MIRYLHLFIIYLSSIHHYQFDLKITFISKMLTFPTSLNINNKSNFLKLHRLRSQCYLRKDIYEHILSHSENEYYSLDDFMAKKIPETNLIIDEIMAELKSLGWNVKLAFGGTGLFIYSTEQPPNNCYE